ncbi:energy-coupling factor ABC transporter permease [Geotalea uraniireducens]|uniref:Cobalamin (Vitamin B12) biosynthesis CbiM protein n=1 Tax=Geotalea uraniireducens (strain Rf4) TaxID=351605 RepID=A5GBP9_GEOUR|nr:energy-coupling factor ABC transporter permease [Geotalea uraniireducens]ABQ24988.1 cobalamin (vitamin B12) biosynthesis CbiM protein [Geotalea uraniireducens Rf4]
MHMADALLSPAVGGTMWAASAGTIAYCSAKVGSELDDRKVPLMGVLGAFLFAAQMINFTIPATGSSGHLGGGLLLTILLGPYAAFLTIASVLVVQALFFADGGLLALGCNIFNMGFFPAFIAYPFIYKKIVGNNPSQTRLTAATMIAAVVGLQLGPFGVVLETLFSGISELPFATFVLLMQPIHLAIGIVEGFVTVAVVSFVYKARPEILQGAMEARTIGNHPVRNVLLAFLAAAILTGGIVSWFASKNPDGLEWAIAKVTGKEELNGSEKGLHGTLAALQQKTAFLPDYAFRKPAERENAGGNPEGGKKMKGGSNLGTSVAGIIGTLMTLALSFFSGFLLKKRKQVA